VRRAISVPWLAAAAVVALGGPLAAKQFPTPTKDNPLRFRAFNVSMPTGIAGTTDIVIERWSTDAERASLLAIVPTLKLGERGQQPLVDALQDIEPRVGFMRTANSLGWDLRYAREFRMDDGGTQIVIATDKRVSFAAASSSARVMDYPFTLIEMRFKPDQEGEGRMLTASSIVVKNGRLEIENYGQEPVRLTSIRLTN
jgi:hypothetical protein